MENAKQTGYNFNSVDLLIYIWKKRVILLAVGLIAGISSIIISLLITPMFESSVIMFPASSASVSKDLLSQNYSGRQDVHGFGEEQQAEQLLQVLSSEPIRSRIIQKYNLLEHYEIEASEKYRRSGITGKVRKKYVGKVTREQIPEECYDLLEKSKKNSCS